MTLVRLAGPFDDPSSRSTPATPTCGGCCCCCCCLVTTFTTATLTAVHVHHEATVAGRDGTARGLVTAGAALAPLLAVALAVTVVWSTESPSLGLLAVVALGAMLAGLYQAAGADRGTVLGAAFGIPLVMSVCFAAELLTLGLGVYGQILALVIPAPAGVRLARRLRERQT